MLITEKKGSGVAQALEGGNKGSGRQGSGVGGMHLLLVHHESRAAGSNAGWGHRL